MIAVENNCFLKIFRLLEIVYIKCCIQFTECLLISVCNNFDSQWILQYLYLVSHAFEIIPLILSISEIDCDMGLSYMTLLSDCESESQYMLLVGGLSGEQEGFSSIG